METEIETKRHCFLYLFSRFPAAVPPEKPRIFSSGRGKEVRLKLGPYEVGDDVRLRCEAVGGRPLAKVTWWRDHALLDDSFDVERDKVVADANREP